MHDLANVKALCNSLAHAPLFLVIGSELSSFKHKVGVLCLTVTGCHYYSGRGTASLTRCCWANLDLIQRLLYATELYQALAEVASVSKDRLPS